MFNKGASTIRRGFLLRVSSTCFLQVTTRDPQGLYDGESCSKSKSGLGADDSNDELWLLPREPNTP